MTGPIVQDTIDPLVLKKLIEESNVPFKNGRASYIFDCPRCGKKQKLYLRKRDGMFICFYCAEIDGFKGKPEFALRELLGLPLSDLKFKLYGIGQSASGAYIEIVLRDFWDEGDGENPQAQDAAALPLVHFPHDFYELDHEFAARGVKYLEGRGVPAAIAAGYDIRYCPPTRRVIFPVRHQDQLYGWQARTILKDTVWHDGDGNRYEIPKILSSNGIPRDRALGFWDRLDGSPHAILCEGPIDALKCHLAGGNVFTMGKAVSDQQIAALIASGVRKVYLGLDPDAALEMERLLREFRSAGLDVYELRPPQGFKDLGEMEMGHVLDVFHDAPRISPGHLFVHVA